jgi:hypothetical protein
MTGSRARHLAVLLIVCVLSTAYVLPFIARGWIPHDEGTLAQSAERVLQGELPHRDFNEVYTGGVTYLHAWSFQWFGVRLLSMRLMLLASFLLCLPAWYALAARFAPRWLAAVVVLTMVVWSVPNYFVSMPSWYTLFMGTLGIWAVGRHVDTGRGRWLVAAGIFGGLSVLAKITGLYFVAAALFFLAHEEPVWTEPPDAAEGSSGAGRVGPHGAMRRWSSFAAAKGAASLFVVGGLVWMIHLQFAPMALLHFVVPMALLLTYSAWRDQHSHRSDRDRWRDLGLVLTPFVVGLAIPLAVFLVPYWRAGAIDALLQGVFVAPQKRLMEAQMPLPPLATITLGLPYGLLLLGVRQWPPRVERLLAIVLAVLLAVLLVFASQTRAYAAVWVSARLMPVLVCAGIVLLLVDPTAAATLDVRRRRLLLLLALMTAMLSLVQFPYAMPIYFCYAAPVVLLAAVALVRSQPGAPRLLHGCVLAFYLVVAGWLTNTTYAWNTGLRHIPYHPDHVLAIDRGGLAVPSEQGVIYERLVTVVRSHNDGRYLYAAPDCPEVYFLTGFRNPTRDLFDFLGDGPADVAAVGQLLDTLAPRVVVINDGPLFSPPMAGDVRALLMARFPRFEQIGQFNVRWRE